MRTTSSASLLLGFLVCRMLLATSPGSADPIAGDVDLSGGVDAIDVQLVINDALGIVVPRSCDVDYSGSTNAVDVQLVINAALSIDIDGDEDGLCDGAEANLGTEADVFDSDGDGTGDGQEMLDGTDPLVPDAGIPPDPEDVAPDIDPTVATDMHTAVSFLYEGDNPVQTGVGPGTVEPARVAVVRGKALSEKGDPLAGVEVTIEGHPELGMTATRQDGLFDMAVNGGGTLSVSYAMEGYLRARRKVDVPWQGFVWAPEVVLIPLDSQVTVIDFSDPIEVAQGSVQTDDDGDRQATLLFPQGAKASLVLSNGRKQGVDELSVRLTEYTVGERGPERMPAELPPSSFYTYAVELSADEALKAGARTVEFSEPVYFYVENFLGFPAGIAAPVGYYDEDADTWVPSQDGRVMDLIGVTSGMAILDVDGDGTADEGAALSALGITEAEREQLASLYLAGQSLIRAPIPHFTAYDINYGIVTLSDEEAIAPDTPEPQVGDGNHVVDPCVLGGWGSIELQNQVLREAVDVVGTPFRLHYASNRTAGYEAARTITIPLTGPDPPSILVRVELEITAGGRQFTESFTNAPNQTYTFVWDGLDAYGREVQGRQQASIRIGYVYDAFYALPPEMAASFGSPSGVRVLGNIPAREPITRWRTWAVNIGPFDASRLGMGGWSLSVHHAYGPLGRILYRGDGRQRRADNMNMAITVVAGGGEGDIGDGDGGLATEANIGNPSSLVVGPDGSIYFASGYWHDEVRKVDPDGIISTIFPGTCDSDMAMGPDGRIHFIWDSGNVVRRIEPNGAFTVVAGNGGSSYYNGDGIPATEANLRPYSLALDRDGSLYIADSTYDPDAPSEKGAFRFTVRRVGPDGIISTFAGTGSRYYSGAGGPASEATLRANDLAFGPDGSLYMSLAHCYQVACITPDGIVRTVAGNGTQVGGGDGGPALEAGMDPEGVAVGPDGSLYVAERGNSYNPWRLRRVGPDGIISTVYEPGGSSSLCVAVGPDGAVYFTGHNDIRKVSEALPAFDAFDIAIPSADGRFLYHFDPRGRHLETLNALTGAEVYSFAYDENGHLATVTDAYGNATAIERDSEGAATAIVAPWGQRTELLSDANGHLASVRNPASETESFGYTIDGLLETATDGRGNTETFGYDTKGQLTTATKPSGAEVTLERTGEEAGHTVTHTTALGRVSTYGVERLSGGGVRRVNTTACCTHSETVAETDGTTTTALADGTTTTRVAGEDPRFGMAAPIDASVDVLTPGGLNLVVEHVRSVELAQADDPLSLTSLTDTFTVNGRVSSTAYQAQDRTITRTSPAGRTTTLVLNEEGLVEEVGDFGLEPVHFAYDDRGRLVETSCGSRQAFLAYSASTGFLESTTDALGNSTSFTIDLAGRVTSVTPPDGSVWGLTWDEAGNLEALTEPNGTSRHTFTCTSENLVGSYQSPLGDVQTFGHNDDGQPALIAFPSGKTIEWAYDGDGRHVMTRMQEGDNTVAYEAGTGLPASVVSRDGQQVAFAYDGALLMSAVWSGLVSGSVDYAYNDDFRVSEHSYPGASLTITYDDDGLLSGVGTLVLARNADNGMLETLSDGVFQVTFEHTSFAEPQAISATHQSSGLYSAQYSRDALGRISQKTETIGGGTHAWVYTYNSMGALIVVDRDGVPVESYAYDSTGRRIAETNTLTGRSLVADDYTYDADSKLLTAGSTTYTYDADSRLSQVTNGTSSTTYHYNTDGTLAGVDLPDGRQIAYQHDSQGRRVTRSVDGARTHAWLYGRGLTPLAEFDGGGSLRTSFIYAVGATPVAMVRGGATYHIVSDLRGTPRLVVDSTGTVVKQIDYDAFGNVVSDTNASFDLPFGFAGGMCDPDHELVRFWARDYQPSTGRWTATDPILVLGGGPNLYAYVGNDPINLVDRNGLEGNGVTFSMSEYEALRSRMERRERRAFGADLGTDSVRPLTPSEREALQEYYQGTIEDVDVIRDPRIIEYFDAIRDPCPEPGEPALDAPVEPKSKEAEIQELRREINQLKVELLDRRITAQARVPDVHEAFAISSGPGGLTLTSGWFSVTGILSPRR